MKKSPGKVRRFFHYYFWCLVTVVGGLVMFAGLASTPMLIVGTGITLIGFAKIILYRQKNILHSQNISMPKYRLTLFVAFNILVVLTSIAGVSISGEIEQTYNSLSEEGRQLWLYAKIAVSMFAVLGTWGLCLQLPFIGIRNYFCAFRNFASRYLGVFLVYQLGFALFSFLCNAVVLLVGNLMGSEGTTLAMTGYFVFVSDNDSSGIGSMGLDALSGLTTASSYFVLSTLAQDTLEKEDAAPFRARLNRMLFDSDTKLLFIMTVLCLVVSIFSGTAGSTIGAVFVLACGIFWLVTMFLFLKNTKLLWYVMNFTTMTFMEIAIPTPELTGIGAGLLAFILLAVRILLFAFIALLIGYDHHFQALREAAAATDPAKNTVTQKVDKVLYSTSILQAGLKTADVIINRKEYAQQAKDKLKDMALEKLFGKK